MKQLKKIGVLTSGGDAPGMNAAIRAVVRTAIFHELEVVGIRQGYTGLLEKQFVPMESHSVSKIMSRGGTILKSSRCPRFVEAEVRSIAHDNLKEAGIDALVVIGGDGSFRGATLLYKEFGFPVIGVPGTIDNDIYGTDFTIGYDTAINTAMEAVDKIRDTADSHNIIFFVEVMGRNSGFIALNTSIATGAEATLIPEIDTEIQDLCHYLEYGRRKNKSSGIIIVAEGFGGGNAAEVARKVKEILPTYDTRVSTLGHIQRGGSPTCNDRVLASRLGYAAVTALLDGTTDVMTGQINGDVVYTPFEQAVSRRNDINQMEHKMAQVLAL
ncbi:MAG: 6-phosphofructokinase [Prevotellaceae bacterium]|jgi:6-phosphofructokinase 1|nr:6-phosphofructokinase [Prevotellaceae bacterium]